MHAHGEDAIEVTAAVRFICDIEKSQRAPSTRPIARNVKIVPAPGAAFARVSFVLAKASSCRRGHRSRNLRHGNYRDITETSSFAPRGIPHFPVCTDEKRGAHATTPRRPST